MYDDYSKGEINDVSIVIILFFLIVLLVSALGLLYNIPYAIISLIDYYIFDNTMLWYTKIITTLCSCVGILFMMSTVPKNPITWYIYLKTPTVTIFNKHTRDKQRQFIDDVEKWIDDNANGQWRRSRNWDIEKMEYQFLRSSDAMAFKLRWI